MTKHENTSTDSHVSSKPIKLSKSYGSSGNSSATSTKGGTHGASKRKSEEENGLDIEENGVRLKVQLFNHLIFIYI